MELSRSQAPDEGAGSRRALAWLGAAVALLAALRFLELGRWSLWIDEAHTLADARALDLGRTTSFPLNLWLIARILDLGGDAPGEALLRAGPACFGVLGLALTAWCFAPLLGTRRALVAALLVGLSSWHLYWSQCARGYTLAQALSLAGAGLLLRAHLRGSLAAYVAGLLVACLAGLAQPSAVLLVAPLFLAPWLAPLLRIELAWRPPTRLVLACALALALAALTWGSSVWSDFLERKGTGDVRHFVQTSGWYFGPALEVAALFGLVRAWRRRQSSGLLAAWVCAFVCASGLVAALFVRATAQYVFVALPWVAALAAHVVLAPDARGLRGHALSALVLLAGVADLTLYFAARHGDRPRWKEAYALVARERGPDDAVFGVAGPVGEYYLDPQARELRAPTRLVRLTHYQDHMLYPWLRSERPIWVVVGHEDLLGWPAEKRERLESFLREQCELVRTFEVPLTPRDLDVSVYRRR